MIRIGLYSEPTNTDVKGYLGLYGGSFLIDYMKKNNSLDKLINWFFEKSRDGQDMEYNEENLKKIVELRHNIKREKWEGNILCFTDDKQIKIPDSTMIGYDICADSMYYSPLGDGFLMEYNKYPEFYSDMSFEMYSKYRDNINDKWLFSSYEMAMNFSKYCNHINKKHFHCIESEDNWRPFAIFIYNQ